ncbi:cellulose-binding protein [Dactylosporangium sp. NPDC005572]|uniref:cellulose-binding protein n=1 Tax=Dactylosporangium sp. NPDC005572 TaxID=3156889 RepID=UPI0033B76244
MRLRLRRTAAVAAATLALLVGVPVVADAAPGQGDNLARAATATASYTSPWESVAAVNDGIDPTTSNDTVNRRWGTWPNTGEQWVLLTWPSAQTLRSADVYFFDDNGGVRLPASWRLQYWTGSAYTDVSGASAYPVAVNRYNAVNFNQVSTSRLRVVLQSGSASVGLLEVRAYASAITTTPTTPPTTGWNPPAGLVTPLNQVWTHQEQTYSNLYGFRNYGWDQLFAGGGSINYCVRWDSSATVSAALRDRIHAALQRQFKKWMDVMVGHNGWPYQNVPVKVVGWAVRDRAQLQWTDTSVDIYVNDIRENAPQCSTPCGRFFNQSGQYPNCPGGPSHHYDMSLWLTAGFGGGAGGDWGQRIGSEYYVGALDADNIHILLHEMGHSFGLDDFYDWTPTGVGGFLMKAGSAAQITEFDAWMFRDWWRHLKNRYGY